MKKSVSQRKRTHLQAQGELDSESESDELEFRKLLEGRKHARKNDIPWPDGMTLDHLKLKALTFIDENQSFQGILSESSNNKDQEDVLLRSDPEWGDILTVSGCVQMVKSQAKLALCPIDVLSAEILSEKLVDVVTTPNQSSKPQHLLSLKQQEIMGTIVKIIKSLLVEQSFSRVHFAKCLSSHGCTVPLEVLWLLHTSHVVSFHTYLASCSRDIALCHSIAAGLIEICSDVTEQEKVKRAEILSAILGMLLILAYPEKIRDSSTKNIMEKVSTEILEKVVKGCGEIKFYTGNDDCIPRLEILEVIRGIEDIPQSVTIKFFTSQLHWLLYGSSSDLVMSHLVGRQSKWRFASLGENTKTRYQQFLYMFEPVAILEMLKQAFSKTSVDWEKALSFVAVFVVCVQEASSLIEDYANRMLSEAISTCDLHSLDIAFLVIRQAALEGTHVFRSYVMWFQNRFSDTASSGLNSKRTVQFFFTFLTDLVPYEPAEYLKVHIIKSPQVPTKLRPFLLDYTTLAKTRLMDLKEPIELSGMYSDSSGSGTDGKNDHTKQQTQAAKDVEKVIEQYEKTGGKVPGTVMEARRFLDISAYQLEEVYLFEDLCIFRKPYYIGRFLPALLVPQKLPDVPDSRARLITTLTKANKIPSHMLIAYQTACKRIAEEHEVSSSDDDSPVSDMDKLTKCLKRMTNIVLQCCKEDESTRRPVGISAQLSLLADHIRTVLNTDHNTAPQPTNAILDVRAPNLDKKLVQIVDDLLNAFCRTCAAVRNTNSTGQGRFKWASEFVALVASLPATHMALYYRLWDLLCSSGGPCLSIHHVYGLAAFLGHLSVHQELITPVIMKTETQPVTDQHYQNYLFVDSLCDAIPFHSSRWMNFNISFSCAYIQHATESFKLVTTEKQALGHDGSSRIVPTSLINKLWYFDHRLSFNELSRTGRNPLSDDTMKILKTITLSSLYENLIGSVPKVSFDQWLTWEMMIHGSEDVLSSLVRRQYQQVTVCGYFMPMAEEEGGCDKNCRKTCSVILNTLLDHNSMKMSRLNGEHCPSNRAEKAHEHTNIDLVHLLQEMSSLLSRQPNDTSRIPQGVTSQCDQWLLGQYYSRTDRVAKERPGNDLSYGVVIANETISFIELSLHLPAYLLFSDDPGSPPSTSALTALTTFANTALRVHVSELCYLPFDVTLHLLKGVLTSLACSGTSSLVSSLLQQLVKECPLFFVSIQYYWTRIKAAISTVYMLCEQPSVLSDAESLHDWTTRFCSEKEVHLSTPVHFPPFVVGASLFLALFRAERPLETVQRLKNLDSEFTIKVAVCLFACFVAKVTEMVLHGHELEDNSTTQELSRELLQIFPEVLLVFDGENEHSYTEHLRSLRNLVCCGYHEKLLPLVFFSIVTSLQDDILRKIAAYKDFSRITALMNKGFMTLRLDCLDDESLRCCGKPFRLDFASKVSVFARKHMHH